MLCTCIELHLFHTLILSHNKVSIKHPLIFIKIMQLIAEEGNYIFNFTKPLYSLLFEFSQEPNSWKRIGVVRKI